ncbi:related to spt23-suppressor of tyretrotransposon [Lichtheimia corymbifera JMRC:FSU:9682]|uniref:Related to spt23-suppressor of tyretrotransposon n=1 Tax=Lichtheimia corymbifera JMRC:FSU:9682 TaxID=1263082 RepID=A0A068RIY4_9FUNG|nr:related to spt23-suppressor of tyretrotransposon [Lichtheimia corymbifera JMRC:FSU:9682]
MTFSFSSPTLTTTDILDRTLHKHQHQAGMTDFPPALEKWMMHDSPTDILDGELPTSFVKQDYDATPASGSPTSQYNDVLNDTSPFNTPRRRHYTLGLDSNDMMHPTSLLTPNEAAYFEMSEYLVHSPESEQNDDASSPTSIEHCVSNSTRDMKLTTHVTAANHDHQKGLHIRVIGAPDKSRVETQTRLCIQLVTGSGTKVTDWPYLKLPERLLAHSRLKRAAQHQQQQELHDKQRAQPLSSLMSKHSSPSQNNDDSVDEDALHLDAKVVCASQPDVAVKVCQGCIQRERKRAERSKTSDYNRILEEFPEQDRILLFNCGPMVTFSSGDAILPTRIACYCRHHSEKKGFCVEFTIRNNKGQEIAKGSSPPILITDDHKSTRHKGRKRSRASMVADTTTSSSTDDLSDKGTFTPPACITPRRISHGGPSSSSSSPSTASSVNSFFDFMVPGSLPTPKGDGEKINHRHSNSRRTSCSFFGDVSPMTTTAPNGKSLIPTLMATRHHSESSNPQVDRLVPSQGPIYGGVEVTVLGSGFYQGLTCFFGEHEAETIYWNPNTLVCVLPPNAHPGPVVVTFKSHSLVLEGHDVPLFTYHDANEQALLELALQVVGLKMTGKLHDAKHIAMKIVQGSGNNNNGNGSLFPSSSAISSSLLTSS